MTIKTDEIEIYYVNKFYWLGKDPMASVSTLLMYALSKTGVQTKLIAAGDPQTNWQELLPVRFDIPSIPTFQINLFKRTFFERFKSTFRFYLSAFLHIVTTRDRTKKTIVITRNTTFLSWLVTLKWFFGCIVLFESHSFHGNNKLTKEKEIHKRLIFGLSNQFKIIERVFLNACDGLICQAELQREFYVKDFVRIPSAVIPLGSLVQNSSMTKDIVSEQQIRKKITYIGSNFGYVDSQLIFDAIAECKDGITFQWIGIQESELIQLKEEVERRGIASRCDLKGWMSHHSMLETMRQEAGAGIVLYKPSMLTSMLVSPTKIFDYFSVALPVIGPRLPSVTAHVHDGIDGVIYETGNVKSLVKTIENIFDNTEKYFEMKKNVAEAAKLCSWDNRAENVITFLNGIIKV